jgi:hypothetical protein
MRYSEFVQEAVIPQGHEGGNGEDRKCEKGEADLCFQVFAIFHMFACNSFVKLI